MPRRHSLCRAALGLAVVLLPVLATAGVRAVPGKDTRPESPRGIFLPVPVPCDQAVQELTLTRSMQLSFTDTTAGDGVVDAYGCSPGVDLSGPEHVYVLTASEDLIVDLGLASNVPIDHDLVLLTECDSDSCVVQANTELSAQLTAGTTVYLVVDGYQGAAGAYTLDLATRPVGIPDTICNGGAIAIDIVDDGNVEAVADSLVGRSNLVSLYDCAPYTVRGGEVWFALTFAASDTDTVGTGHGDYREVAVTAATSVPTLDLALWLFADCGPDAECLAFVDDGIAGGEEMLEWSNRNPEPLTVYLAVDCIRAPGTEEGDFELTFTTTVPVEPRTITNVRNLFR